MTTYDFGNGQVFNSAGRVTFWEREQHQPRQLYPGHPDWDACMAENAKRAEPILQAALDELEKGLGK